MELLQTEAAPCRNCSDGMRKTAVLYALGAADTETLCMLGGILADAAVKKSSLYLAGGSFYLAVEEPEASGGLRPLGVLSEFGTRLSAPAMLSWLSEHADCLADGNAAGVLAAVLRGEVLPP